VRLDDKVTRYCILCDGDVRRNTWAVGGFEQELPKEIAARLATIADGSVRMSGQ
jgi:hypothetical protein